MWIGVPQNFVGDEVCHIVKEVENHCYIVCILLTYINLGNTTYTLNYMLCYL
jgi:hypothetical protein